MNLNKKIILGSKSPRRKELLERLGIACTVRFQDTEEDFDTQMEVLNVAEMLAVRKANALRPTLHPDEILITADSVVIVDGQIYNKPANYEEGMQMLQALSGKTHTVATGFCILSCDRQFSDTVCTYVTFDLISVEEIDYYLQKDRPYDKAGGYGIQDWIGNAKISGIEGSYTNVMGLPTREVYLALQTFMIL